MPQIGAGSRILMGDAANPNSAANGGSDANLDDVTDYLTGFSITQNQNTVDVTRLDADLDGFFRDYIPGLNTGTASGNVIEPNNALPASTRFAAIQAGTNHPKGRGFVDVRVLVGGDVTGYAQLDMTIIITEGAGVNLGVEDAIGSPFSAQICGAITRSAQA